MIVEDGVIARPRGHEGRAIRQQQLEEGGGGSPAAAGFADDDRAPEPRVHRQQRQRLDDVLLTDQRAQGREDEHGVRPDRFPRAGGEGRAEGGGRSMPAHQPSRGPASPAPSAEEGSRSAGADASPAAAPPCRSPWRWRTRSISWGINASRMRSATFSFGMRGRGMN